MIRSRFKTNGFQGTSVQYSPFYPNRLAIGTSSNFGIVGNGRLFILDTSSNQTNTYDTQDAIFDIAWSEINSNMIACGCGDGSILVFDQTLPDFPVQKFKNHEKEVFGLSWNLKSKLHFVSCSWDQTVRLWDPQSGNINSWKEHQGCVYQVSWAPFDNDIFASCSADQTIKLWDTRIPQSTTTIHAHSNEILSIDWNKYVPHQIVSGSVDTLIKVTDTRMSRTLYQIQAHELAVKKVKCSPFHADMIGSVSYDMTFRLFNQQNQIYQSNEHTEFVTGLDFSLFDSTVASSGWDEMVFVHSL